jgi:hypothetical protein
VEARRVGDRLHLRVRDDGPGPPADAESTGGIGLANVRERLGALYGADHTFRIDRADGGGCIVSIECPFHTRPIPSEAVPAAMEPTATAPTATDAAPHSSPTPTTTPS